jgi:hypothetical protein
MSRESRYRKIAVECYERVLRETGRFDIEDVRDAILAEVLAQGVSEDIVDDFVDGLVKDEDKRRAQAAELDQLDLFSGEPAALDAVWRLGDGQRVMARHATRSDVFARLRLKRQHIEDAQAAYERDEARMARLLPYMTDDSITVEIALDAWKRDNQS